MASQAVKEAARSMAGSVKKMFRKANEMLHLGVVTERMHTQGSSTTGDSKTGRPAADPPLGEPSSMASQAVSSVKEAARSMADSVRKMYERMHAQGISTTEDIETGRPLADRSRGETARDDAEATKHARKVAQVTIAAASSGILTLIIGVLAIEHLKHAYSLHMKISVLFLLASVVSGACLILHAGSLHMRIVKTLVTTTLGALVLAVVYVGVAFLTL